jgi:putative N6-adenine-specific DNA methylase
MNHQFFAVSARGIERVTAGELEQLGAVNIKPVVGGVHFEGDMLLLYRASLWLRTASRILKTLREFAAQSSEMLYSQARRVRWEDYLDASKTFAVQATIEAAARSEQQRRGPDSSRRPSHPPRGRGFDRRPPRKGIDNSMYAALKVKDAIADRLRREQGQRPNVDKEFPDILVHAHFAEGRCILSLDATGSSLHERGYRGYGAPAPLKETLAAAIIELTGWDGHVPLFDPMCGSGTLVIEAALKAMKMAPGLARRKFGFQRWPQYDGAAWQEIVDDAKRQRQPAPKDSIFASEIDASQLTVAMENAKRAGVEEAVVFKEGRFEEAVPPSTTPGVVVFNPPYGARLGQNAELQSLYEKIGPVLNDRFAGWKAFILAGNLPLARHINLPATEKFRLNNGPIECRLLKFEPAVVSNAGGEPASNFDPVIDPVIDPA